MRSYNRQRFAGNLVHTAGGYALQQRTCTPAAFAASRPHSNTTAAQNTVRTSIQKCTLQWPLLAQHTISAPTRLLQGLKPLEWPKPLERGLEWGLEA
jgi:hypothetical protein